MQTTGRYRVISGTFRMPDGTDRGPGQFVDLDPDVARALQARVVPAAIDAATKVDVPRDLPAPPTIADDAGQS